MTPLWLALLDHAPATARAVTVTDMAGTGVGDLCAWCTSERPHAEAHQADPRLFDPAGPACVVSLALAPADARPIADDPTVVEARRAVLRDGRAAAVTLLTADPVHIAGALTVAHADQREEVAALRRDPFAALWDTRVLLVAPGLLGRVDHPTGPSLERYAGTPWPYDRFPS